MLASPLGKYLITFFGLSLFLLPFVSAAFSDVSSNQDWHTSVSILEQRGVIRGYPDGTFRPQQPVSRAEFTKLLVAMFGLEDDMNAKASGIAGQFEFPDVPKGSWFEPFVQIGAGLGIIQGYPDGTFHPEATVTLAEASKMVVIASGLPVPPAHEGDEWFVRYVQPLAQSGAFPRFQSLTFSTPLERATVAEMLFRAELIKENALRPYLTEKYGRKITDGYQIYEMIATLSQYTCVCEGGRSRYECSQDKVRCRPGRDGESGSSSSSARLTRQEELNQWLQENPDYHLSIMMPAGDRVTSDVIRSIPPEIGRFTSLYTLILVGNELTALPKEMAQLKRLRDLDISDNRFTVFPDVILSVGSMETLKIGGNRISSIPDGIRNLKKLTELDVTGNPLTKEQVDRLKVLLPHTTVKY